MAVRLSRRKIAEYCTSELLAGRNSQELAKMLAAYLVDSNRTKELDDIVDDINYELSLNGVVTAEIVSAHALDSLTAKSIKNLVAQITKAKTVDLEAEVDPALLGGFRLDFAGLELDTTMTKKLNSLRTEL